MSIPYTYPLWYRERVSKLSGTLAERSKISGCSVSTVCRIDKKSAENGTIIDKSPPSNTRGMNKAMNEKESACLCWFVMLYPAASWKECIDFIRAVSGRELIVSASTISREIKRLGMTHKKMIYYSNKRDESDRVIFQCRFCLKNNRSFVLWNSH